MLTRVAVGAMVSKGTRAVVVINSIVTCAFVHTRLTRAFVDVYK